MLKNDHAVSAGAHVQAGGEVGREADAPAAAQHPRAPRCPLCRLVGCDAEACACPCHWFFGGFTPIEARVAEVEPHLLVT